MNRSAFTTFACGLLAASTIISVPRAGLAHPKSHGNTASRPAYLPPCGAAALTGEAPAIMTYDATTGTQVFVGGKGDTDVAAFNRRTGSVAALKGDLGQAGVVSACSNDGVSRDAYSVTSSGPGQLNLVGRDGTTREDFQVSKSPGESPDISGDYKCWKGGLGLFTSDGVLGPAVAVGNGVAAAGIAGGTGFLGLGVDARNGLPLVGPVAC